MSQPSVRSAWKQGESPGGGVALDDFDVDAEGGGAFDDLGAVGAVGDAGGGDQDREEQDEGVGDDAALAAGDLLAGIVAHCSRTLRVPKIHPCRSQARWAIMRFKSGGVGCTKTA